MDTQPGFLNPKYIIKLTIAVCNIVCWTSVGVETVPIGARTSMPDKCTASGIAVYNVTVETFWSPDLFPKQYPRFRPHAQWSRLIGRSHNDEYMMWRKGSIATAALKQYSETGETSLFDLDTQGQQGIFDVFGGPNIYQGAGKATTNIYLDESHVLVSLMLHLIPSPDWFVGLDSESLCSGNEWLSEKVMSLGIWDAGTDKGLTFTAPNWQENPQRPISEITANHPNLPACALYYEGVEDLPVIAKVTFTKSGSGAMSHSFNEVQRDWQGLQGELSSYNMFMPKNDGPVQHGPSKRDSDEGSKNEPMPKMLHGELPSSGFAAQAPTVGNSLIIRQPSGPVGKREPAIVSKPSENDVITSWARSQTEAPSAVATTVLTKAERKRKKREERIRRKKEKQNKRNKAGKKKRPQPKGSLVSRTDQDCVLSEWGKWSACSKTCGYGNRTRMRTVLQSSSGKGRRCPVLTEEEMCGTMRGCGWNHFSSDIWGSVGK